MKIYLGADHNGYRLKERVETYLKHAGFDVHDEGDEILDPDDDFTVFASRVVAAVKSSNDKDPRGILICGSGQGMAIAANRHKGIRAGLGFSKESARSTRHDEDSNVLALPAELLEGNIQLWQDIIHTWLKTPFAGAARYKRRNRQLDEL
jgi:ribose 5-phosphate isomerase B